ncbi:tetratricopeptide repeat protein [Corynebacterium casei]|uniref:tetratricopeptide repeat protein n=1 Tax=Corynebacterium casei TaxID=160386 RepID=UPI003FD51DCE
MSVDNYYEILGIESSADEETIRKAIKDVRRKARQKTGSPVPIERRSAEALMEQLDSADRILLDPAKRKEYDNELLRRPVERKPESTSNNTTSWIDSAKAYLANGQPRNAVQAAKQATLNNPENPEAWLVRAYADLEIRDYVDAEFSANEAQQRDLGNPAIYGLLGDIFDGEDRYREAVGAFQSAANLVPDDPYWHGRVIWAIYEGGDLSSATSESKKLHAKFPESEFVRMTYSMLLLYQADEALSRDDEHIWVTNTAQINYLKNQLEAVRSLNAENEVVHEGIQRVEKMVEKAEKRSFVSPGIGYWVWRVILIVFVIPFVAQIFGGGLMSALFMVLSIAFISWRAFNRVYPVGWKYNQKTLPNVVLQTGIQK